MKILYTVITFSLTGGSNILVQELSQTLTNLKHDSVIFTSNLPTDLEIKSTKNYIIKKIPYMAYDLLIKSRSRIKTSKLSEFLKWAINGTEVFIIYHINKFAKKHSLPLLWGLFRDPFGWKLLLKMLFSNLRDIDVIYTTPIPHSLITATLLAAKIKKIPVTVTPAYHPALKVYSDNDYLWSRILRKFNVVFPHTNAELNYLNKFKVPKSIQKTMGAGVQFEKINSAGSGVWRKKLNIPESKFTVLYLDSSINSYYKGIDSVIKSSILLPLVHFIFVGRYEKDWKLLKKKYKLFESKNISYIQFVSTKEKFQLLNSVDLLVKPSLIDSFGIFYFEGLSAGKPIICANIEPMIELSKDVGLHVPFNDVEKLVEKITILKENKKLYEKLSKNALIKAEKYSWGNLGKKFERIFKLISK